MIIHYLYFYTYWRISYTLGDYCPRSIHILSICCLIFIEQWLLTESSILLSPHCRISKNKSLILGVPTASLYFNQFNSDYNIWEKHRFLCFDTLFISALNFYLYFVRKGNLSLWLYNDKLIVNLISNYYSNQVSFEDSEE